MTRKAVEPCPAWSTEGGGYLNGGNKDIINRKHENLVVLLVKTIEEMVARGELRTYLSKK